MTICVLTDPSAVMPAASTHDKPIRVIPLEVAWPDGSLDPGDLPYSTIAAKLTSAPVPPTTGAPSPGVFAEAMRDALESHDGVVVVCPSADLSTTYASAVLAAQDVDDERVRVIDAKTAAAGQGLVASQAAARAVEGADINDVCDRSVFVAERIHIWATLSQLQFLSRSGRLPSIAAAGAGALGLQPVVRYAGGSPTPVGVVRSGRRGAERLVRAWDRSLVPGAPLHAVVFHSARDDDAVTICAEIRTQIPDADVDTVEVTASLAAHTGPGLLGLAWFWDN